MTEIWKSVPGFEGSYEVSDCGRVRSLDRVVLRKAKFVTHHKHIRGAPLPNRRSKSHGYCHVDLHKDGVRKAFLIHRLVMLAFEGSTPDGQEVCHCDGNKQNNALDNLRYDTRINNHADKRRHGTYLVGEQTPTAKLTLEEVRRIRQAVGTHESIAKGYPVQRSQIGRIKSGECWPIW